MLNEIVGLIIKAADELEEHKNDEAYNGRNGDTGYALHALGNLLKESDVFAKFANRLRRNSLYYLL